MIIVIVSFLFPSDIAAQHSCPCYASAVGEANVAALMARMHAVLGGEGNGGIMSPDVHTGRDSLVGLSLVLQLLSEWRCGSGRFMRRKSSSSEEEYENEEEDALNNEAIEREKEHRTSGVCLSHGLWRHLPEKKEVRTLSALKALLPQYENIYRN